MQRVKTKIRQPKKPAPYEELIKKGGSYQEDVGVRKIDDNGISIFQTIC